MSGEQRELLPNGLPEEPGADNGTGPDYYYVGGRRLHDAVRDNLERIDNTARELYDSRAEGLYSLGVPELMLVLGKRLETVPRVRLSFDNDDGEELSSEAWNNFIRDRQYPLGEDGQLPRERLLEDYKEALSDLRYLTGSNSERKLHLCIELPLDSDQEKILRCRTCQWKLDERYGVVQGIMNIGVALLEKAETDTYSVHGSEIIFKNDLKLKMSVQDKKLRDRLYKEKEEAAEGKFKSRRFSRFRRKPKDYGIQLDNDEVQGISKAKRVELVGVMRDNFRTECAGVLPLNIKRMLKTEE